ncbi:MAG: hypothetical protein ACE5FS_05510 [Paracoccaceae bacterium]
MHHPARRARKLAGWLLLFALAPARLGAEQISQTYDVYIGGLRVGEMTLSADVGNGRYAARGSVSDGGMTSLFFDYRYVGHVDGFADGDDRLRPLSYRSREVEDSETTKKVRIGFAADAPDTVLLDPAPKPRRFDIDPRAQTGAVDPLTSFVLLLRDRSAGSAPCGGVIDLFDGRRLSRISLVPAGRDAGRIVCKGDFRRVAGFSRKKLRKRRRFPIALFLRPKPDGGAQVESFTALTKFGTVTATRR